MVENNVLFTKNRGNGKKGEETLIVDDEHVTIQSRQGGSVVVNFKGSEDDINKIVGFFHGLNEAEPLMLNIAGSGDVDHYFRGISEIGQNDDGMSNLQVTLQFLSTTV
jgi:hypothetical protein